MSEAEDQSSEAQPCPKCETEVEPMTEGGSGYLCPSCGHLFGSVEKFSG